jgi:hypothetical protein
MMPDIVLHVETMPELPGWELVSLAEAGNTFLLNER